MASERFFDGFKQFGAFCARVPIFERAADIAARAAVGEFFTKEIKSRFGDADRLPPPLAESTQIDREKHGFSPDATLLRTGALRDSISWGHTSPWETVVGSDSPIAVYHELGGVRAGQSGRPPQRSFITSTVAEKEEEAFGVYLRTFAEAFRPE